VYVPAVSDLGPGDSYRVTVDVPLSFGSAHLAGAAASERQTVGGRQLFTFDESALRQNALALAFGDATIYRANFNFPLRNSAPWPQTLSVTLPPDLNNQKSYLKSLTPQPSSTRLDRDGNVLAQYRLAPGQSLIVQTQVLSEVKYVEYDVAASGYRRDIPADLVATYTKSSQYWPTGGGVAAAAAKLNNDQAPTVENVKAMYQFVIDRLSYNKDKIKFNVRQGADKALANPENAVCLEYADLLVAMLRSQGIPARMPVGYGYSSNLKTTSTVADSLHAWVEAYVPGIGWMTLDPTWGEKFDQFGRSDLDHFAFAVWGETDQSPAAVMTGGRDLGYQYEAATLGFEASISSAPLGGTVKATRYFVLPFVSLTRVRAQADSTQATDAGWLRLGQAQLPLGSLAPGQTITFNHPEFGNFARSAEYGRIEKSKPVVLAASEVQVNYWPMVGLATFTLLGSAYLIVIRLRPRNPNRETTVEPSS
jgi:transglutaminase-like putative cysteine protease